MTDIAALLKFYARALWYHRWATLAVAWAICIAGWTYFITLPDQYTTRASVQVTARPLAPFLRGIIGATDPDQQDQRMVTMRADLLGTPAMESVVQRAGILRRDATEADVRIRAEALARRIGVLIKDQNIFDIAYTDADRSRSQRVVEALIDTLVERNVAAERHELDRALRFVEAQIGAYEARLREAETRLAEFQRQHGGALGTSQGYTRHLEELTTQEQKLRADQQAKTWQRDRIRAELRRTPEWLSKSPGSPTLRQQRLEKLQQEYAELSKRYTENYPDIVALKAQIAAAEDLAAHRKTDDANVVEPGSPKFPNPDYQRLQQDLLKIEGEVVAAQLQREAVDSSIQSLRTIESQIPEIEAQTAELNRDYKILQSSYAKLIERREAIRLAEDMEGANSAVAFQTVEKPRTSSAPIGPNRPLYFTAVTGAGIGGGIGYAILAVALAGEAPGTLEGLRAIVTRPVIGVVSMVRRRRPFRTAASLSTFAIGWLMLVVIFTGLVYVYSHQLTQFQPRGLANQIRQSWSMVIASSESCDTNLAPITGLHPPRRPAACH